jgi:hypothetical protein
MSGGTPSVNVVLRNPLNYSDQIDYTIKPYDHELSYDWIAALKELLRSGNLLEKNFCFIGFPTTSRNLEFLCSQLNQAVDTINNFFNDYQIQEVFTPENVVAVDYAKDGPNHELLNILHNHFEVLQGTVWNLSDFYQRADYDTKYAIRQLNNLCHEIETLILSQRKAQVFPYWVRPSQITTFINAKRYNLKESHRQLFSVNGYDREQGGVYMHWTQIGKTLFEVFRDEHAPELTDTVCEAITELKYYSGEFDVEWGKSVMYGGPHEWHNKQIDNFKEWLISNDKDPDDINLSLGYLPLGQVNLSFSFGTLHEQTIQQMLSNHLDIYKIEVDGVTNTFDYCWSDYNYKQMQIDIMKPGYDYSCRRG